MVFFPMRGGNDMSFLELTGKNKNGSPTTVKQRHRSPDTSAAPPANTTSPEKGPDNGGAVCSQTIGTEYEHGRHRSPIRMKRRRRCQLRRSEHPNFNKQRPLQEHWQNWKEDMDMERADLELVVKVGETCGQDGNGSPARCVTGGSCCWRKKTRRRAPKGTKKRR